MIHKEGNLLDQVKPSNIVVHGCNLQGVWGSGVAKQMKEKFPVAFEKYQYDLKKIQFGSKLGNVSWYETETLDNSIIASAFTQEWYGKDGKRYVSYDAIDKCFTEIFAEAKARKCQVHIPNMIGAGLGGGDYDVIVSIIECAAYAQDFRITDIYCWKFV